ncbi:MAG: hypothetical protein ING08_19190 [Roseomonas sp.]|nr:hypothetical protein [Roseomonas sp.]MCA3382355.1 hypothetical protein [Roseomonas sp.]
MPLPPDSPLRRRLLVLRLAGTGAALPLGGALAQGRKSPAPPEPDVPRNNRPPAEQRPSGETDADPGDAPGNGRGAARGGPSLEATDADPSDPPGRGRGGNGVNDADPGDMPGRGRGNARVTDADPGDQPGQGRGGGRQAGPSDADPGDPAGQGRGAAPPQLRTGFPAKKA